jgi:endonuclease/exonuclease/phosphatase family metal-dependent hydrolase
LLFTRTRSGALVALLAGAAVVAPQAALAKTKAKAHPDVTVMSRNLYLGADIIQLATARTTDEEQAKAQQLHQTVDATNFPLRAKRLAAEVSKNKPDIIGLQEVARYYRGPDGVHDSVKNATTPLYDFLAIYQKELRAKGQKYKVVSRQDEIDVEVPSADGYDIRLKLGNAVLLRTNKGEKVKFKKDVHGIFTDQLTVPLADQSLRLTRGYAGMDGTVAGKKFRFLDPHGEAYSPDATTKQLKELLRTAAKSKKVATIIAGDFNQDPKSADAGGYRAVIAAGFKDTGKRASTCCQDERLDNTTSKLDQWIDHIVVRPKATVLKRTVVGNLLSDRIGGLWPSDHAGLVVKLRLK